MKFLHKIAILVLFIAFGSIVSNAANDEFLILRNGRELVVKIVSVSDKQVIYQNTAYRNASEEIIPLTDVYLIHYKNRGNVYITPEGKRISGENNKLPKDATLIYLTTGGELPVYSAQIIDNKVIYQIKSQSKNGFGRILGTGNKIESYSIPADSVFLIKYADGTRDIITDIQIIEKQNDELTAVVEEPIETPAQLIVIYHTVARNETLGQIAEKYNVEVNDIKNWNELSTNLTAKSKVKTGLQLILYVTQIKQ